MSKIDNIKSPLTYLHIILSVKICLLISTTVFNKIHNNNIINTYYEVDTR